MSGVLTRLGGALERAALEGALLSPPNSRPASLARPAGTSCSGLTGSLLTGISGAAENSDPAKTV